MIRKCTVKGCCNEMSVLQCMHLTEQDLKVPHTFEKGSLSLSTDHQIMDPLFASIEHYDLITWNDAICGTKYFVVIFELNQIISDICKTNSCVYRIVVWSLGMRVSLL